MSGAAPEGSASPPTAGDGRRRRLLAWLLPAALALWTFPAVTPPGSAGLDGAWILELNRLATSRHHFGPEVAFTYGPLGRLLYPVDMGSHLLQASLLRFAFAVAYAGALVRLARRAERGWVLVAAALAQVAAFALGLDSRYFGFEYQLMLIVPLLAWEALEARSAAGLAAIAAAGVMAVFAKTTLGVSWMAAVGTATALAALRRDWRLPGAAAAAGAAALAAAAWLLFSSPGDLVPWLRATLDIAGGYSEAMSLGGLWGLTVGGVAALLGFLGLVAWLVARRSPAAGLALLFAAPAFLAYKHAFVRQDALHTAIFFTWLAAVLGLLALETGEGRGRAAALAGAGLALVLAIPARHKHPDHEGFPWRALAGVAGVSNAAAWATLAPIRREQAGRDVAQVTAPGLRSITGDDLGVVPWELGYCFANGIDCVPNPTLQTFSAYTPRLDRASAHHYSGPSAPEFVLVGADGLDRKSVALEAPALWRALVDCYRPAPVQPARLLLLARVAGECARPQARLGASQAHFGTWVPVPPSAALVSAAVALDLGWAGRLVKAIHKLPPLFLELGFRSGRTRSIRLVPDTARDGLPLDLVPEDASDLDRVFRREPPADRVAQIRVSGPGAFFYREPFEVTLVATPR